MNDLLMILLTIVVTAIVARFVLKKYNTVFVFFAAGIIILIAVSIFKNISILGEETTGSNIVDVFAFISKQFISNISGVGTIIMTVTGYSAYMKHIKASDKLAFIVTKPLKKIKNPYIVLSGVYVIGLLLKLVITSQAAVALLLLATTFPVLMALGINKITAASVLTLICIDWGPNDGSTIFAAEVAGMEVVDFVLNHQVYIVVPVMILLAIIIPFYYKWMDRKDEAKGIVNDLGEDMISDPECPWFYSLLPIIPLIIVFTSSLMKTVIIDVVSANFIGLAIVFIIEFIRRKDRSNIPNDMKVVIRAMADVFVNVVSIIISASIFAAGINQLGGVSLLADYISSLEGASILTVILMSLITFLAAIIMGSGAASWFSFGPLTGNIAKNIGLNQLGLIVPMEVGAAIGRGLSPVAGATIAISGHADSDAMDVVKRTVPLGVISFVITIVISIVLYAF